MTVVVVTVVVVDFSGTNVITSLQLDWRGIMHGQPRAHSAYPSKVFKLDIKKMYDKLSLLIIENVCTPSYFHAMVPTALIE